jgi:hypothetical protein
MLLVKLSGTIVDFKGKQINSLVAPVFNPVYQCATNAAALFR